MMMQDSTTREAKAMASLQPSVQAIRLDGRGITPLPIGEGGLPVPGLEGVLLLPGLTAPDRWWSADEADALVRRIAPWATVYLTPGWQRPGRRCDGLYWHGTAWAGPDVAVVNAARRGPLLLATLLHELWHLVEPRLSTSDQVELTVSLLEGKGMAWQGEYSASRKECLARAFSSYASAKLLEGFDVRGVPTFDRVLEGGAA